MSNLREFLKKHWATFAAILVPLLTTLAAWMWQTAAYSSYVADGDKLMRQHNFYGAEQNYKSALECVPFYINWRNVKAIFHPEKGAVDSPQTTFFKTFSYDPYKEMMAHFKLGSAMKNKGSDFLQAAVEFQRALEIASVYFPQLTKETGLGELDLIDLTERQGKYDDALQSYNKFLTRRLDTIRPPLSDSRDMQYLRFCCYHRIGRIKLVTEQSEERRLRLAAAAFDKAKALQDKVILKDRESKELLAVFLLDLAALARQQKDRQAADKYYTEVGQLFETEIGKDYPEYPTYLLARVDFIMENANAQELHLAEDLLDEALNLTDAPNMRTQVLRRQFHLYVTEKNEDKVRDVMTTIEQQFQNDSKNQNALSYGFYLIDKSWYLVSKGKTDEAKAAVAKAYELVDRWQLPQPPVFSDQHTSAADRGPDTLASSSVTTASPTAAVPTPATNVGEQAPASETTAAPQVVPWDLTHLPSVKQRAGVFDNLRQVSIYVRNCGNTPVTVVLDNGREGADIPAGKIASLSNANIGDSPTLHIKDAAGQNISDHPLGILADSRVFLDWSNSTLSKQLLKQ